MDELCKVLGYVPNSVLKKMILQQAAEEGITIEQAALRYRMPQLIISGTDPMPDRIYPKDVIIK